MVCWFEVKRGLITDPAWYDFCFVEGPKFNSQIQHNWVQIWQKGSSGIHLYFMQLNFEKKKIFWKIWHALIFTSNCFNTVTKPKTHISYTTKLFISSMLPWQPLRNKDYPKHSLCYACYIKRCVNLCLLYSLYSDKDVELEETHRISRILLFASLNHWYKDVNVTNVETSSTNLMTSNLDWTNTQLQTLISLLFVKSKMSRKYSKDFNLYHAIKSNFVELYCLMLHAKFLNHRPSCLEKKICKFIFAIYSHDDHLGHVTWTIYANFCSPFLRQFLKKFGFDLPSSFGGEYLWTWSRTPEHGHSICAFVSDELKIVYSCIAQFCCIKVWFSHQHVILTRTTDHARYDLKCKT